MKKISILLVLAMMVTLLAGCQLFCSHEWADATCEAPKTCTKCEKTEGEALGHTWADATCEAPKTCEKCEKTEGEALGHAWVDATCEAPKTCSVCQATEGEPLPLYETEESKALQGKWYTVMSGGAEEMGLEGFDGALELGVYMEFTDMGEFTMSMEMLNWEAFRQDLIDYMNALLEEEYDSMGITREEADQAMMADLGMSIDEFILLTVDSMDFSAMLDSYSFEMVYYALDGQLYLADSWDDVLEGSGYTLENDVLIIEEVYGLDGVTLLEWTRAE